MIQTSIAFGSPPTYTRRMESATICYLLQGEAGTAEGAARMAERYKNCPYAHFMAAVGAGFVAVFYLPEEQRWWIEEIAKRPKETLGLESAIAERIPAPSHPRTIELRIDRISERTACDSFCPECPAFDRCLRCPACTSYRGTR